jgi:hypothetical protein
LPDIPLDINLPSVPLLKTDPPQKIPKNIPKKSPKKSPKKKKKSFQHASPKLFAP